MPRKAAGRDLGRRQDALSQTHRKTGAKIMDDKKEPAIFIPPLDEKLRLHLGGKLKLLFAETAQTPIPDRFAALLDRLEGGGMESAPLSKRAVTEGVDNASKAES